MPKVSVGNKYKIRHNGKFYVLTLIKIDRKIEKYSGFTDTKYWFECGKEVFVISPQFIISSV